MKKGTYTATAHDKQGNFKTIYIDAENEQEAEQQARSKARYRNLNFIEMMEEEKEELESSGWSYQDIQQMAKFIIKNNTDET